MIERDTGLKVNLVQDVGGGTANIHPAMTAGKFKIYPEYTGTAWNAVLEKLKDETRRILLEIS